MPYVPISPPLTDFLISAPLKFVNNIPVVMRVPGLPIRDCARGCDNRAHTRPQLSAIDMTEKTFFERMYLVPEMGTFGP